MGGELTVILLPPFSLLFSFLTGKVWLGSEVFQSAVNILIEGIWPTALAMHNKSRCKNV